ncbi:hypothetical protein Hanom_Chr03g00199521 [Helianthus anomalus]
MIPYAHLLNHGYQEGQIGICMAYKQKQKVAYGRRGLLLSQNVEGGKFDPFYLLMDQFGFYLISNRSIQSNRSISTFSKK